MSLDLLRIYVGVMTMFRLILNTQSLATLLVIIFWNFQGFLVWI